tara:strand:- start:86 stop:865 length:780 start_codon:yes stop_codon:yes gene_type:complete
MGSISQYTIFGERCSGTNHLERTMAANFDLPLTWEFAWKHFFCEAPNRLPEKPEAPNTLFLCIVRRPDAWANSLYRDPHHMTGYAHRGKEGGDNRRIMEFLTRPVEKGGEPEVNALSGQQYRNVMRMRGEKIHYMLDLMPKLARHLILIRHEDMLSDFGGQMKRIRALIPDRVRPGIAFPVNHTGYKDAPDDGSYLKSRSKKVDWIKPSLIYGAPGFDPALEKRLGYTVPQGHDLSCLRRAFLRQLKATLPEATPGSKS